MVGLSQCRPHTEQDSRANKRDPGVNVDDETVDPDRVRVERLLKDPRVIVHYQKTREPFVSELRGMPHVDVLDLLERREQKGRPEADICAPNQSE